MLGGNRADYLSEDMQTTLEERPALASHGRSERLAERLRARLAVEERFRSAGGKIKTKSIFRRYEKRVVAPFIETGLKMLGLYERGRRQAISPVVSGIELSFPNLPSSFDGFRILHLSDLHIDGVPGLTDNLMPLLDQIEADVCLITGDYRFEDEGPTEEMNREIRQLLPHIHAQHGVFGTLGNHDESPIAFELENMGIRMLINDSAEIERGGESIWIAGLDDDFDYKCHDLGLAMAQVPRDAFTVLMAHSPDLYREAADMDVDLYLCGHTHGGQVRLPGIGAVRSNARVSRKYTYGSWRYRQMQGYTSGGIGCSSLPVRLNCPPEVVLITVRSN